ncbi:hypothetical protein SNE26_17380 [Mucilaginibacter sp. cycad4]|uniref:hypothetical protein n=1 Tax=Mucilaginibacter sp. cycad4 TaxID=3342096 RepID=UPI002AABD622|nr:hypothetical protein [Mucilaginibacter gossypii]WPU97802.1 hypothetical protein SNE26_17380 [Mucilaginibacter gossypii]
MMALTIIKIALFLCFISLPLIPLEKRKREETTGKQSIEVHSKYSVNEEGYIVSNEEEKREI